MRPGVVGLEVGSVGECQVDGVEGHDQVLGVVDLLKRPLPRQARSGYPM